MFEDKPTSGTATSKSSAPEGKSAASIVPSMVIHTMPKEFYDREITVKQDLPPQPVPVVAPLPPTSKPVSLPQPKRSNNRLMVGLVLVICLVAGSLLLVYQLGLFTSAEPVVVAPTPTPTPEPVVSTIKPEPVPVRPVSGADTDSDGLSNVEELLYGTDFRNPDSDGDTYLDGNEIFHRFDPRGLAPSTLLDTGAVRVLESLDLPFTVFYPTTWNPISTPASQRVSFRSATGASVNVLWQDNDSQLSLESWYETQVNEVELSRLQLTTTKEGYQALIGPDERIMYLAAGPKMYTLIYDLGESKSIEFLQTFKMIVNSFKLVP